MALDGPTKIGIGGAAACVLSAILGAEVPQLPWKLLLPLLSFSAVVCIWGFLPAFRSGQTSKSNTPDSVATLRSSEGSVINAEGAEITSNVSSMFPGGFANASGGSLINMPGVKVIDSGGGTLRVQVSQSESDLEPLSDAGRRVLEANLDNLIGQMAMSEDTPDRRLDWMGYWIAESHNIQIYGKRPPSQRYELIPPERLKQLQFAQGAKVLQENFGNDIIYVDLAVQCEDIGKNWQSLVSPQRQ